MQVPQKAVREAVEVFIRLKDIAVCARTQEQLLRALLNFIASLPEYPSLSAVRHQIYVTVCHFDKQCRRNLLLLVCACCQKGQPIEPKRHRWRPCEHCASIAV